MNWRNMIRSLLLLPSVVLLIAFTRSGRASSTDGSGASYTSVRALDQFGHSIQLQHAREAARRHGRLVLSATSPGNGTIVVVSIGSKPMVQPLTLPTGDDNSSAFLSMCCAGVKGDANWLILNVRQHMARIWNRYDHTSPNSGAIAHYISRLLGSFNGEDVDMEWQSSLGRDQGKWARPLGIQTLVFSSETPHILMIEPSGRVLSTKDDNSAINFATMGKNSDIVMEHYQRVKVDLDGTMDSKELEELLIKLLLEIETNSRDDLDVMVETLDSRGIERHILRYKNGEKITT